MTIPKTMKAAILIEQRKPLMIDEVQLPPTLEIGQVLVKVHFSGICGSQLGEIDGAKGEDKFLPHLLGHEASGIVEAIGPGVKHVNNARSIRFLGRDRETDEELRQRAKQVLLASGRASSTSIETALLSMPGVRAVCIKEDRTRPGMIQIFIDGLTEQNYASLQQRVDQVRAAGIYVMLEPAHLINLTLTIRISVDRRVKGEERSALEQRVTDAVESFIQRIPMGQPLLFSQLTAEILSSKGVVDLDDFRLRAEQLTDPANPQITQYGISARRINPACFEKFIRGRQQINQPFAVAHATLSVARFSFSVRSAMRNASINSAMSPSITRSNLYKVKFMRWSVTRFWG